MSMSTNLSTLTYMEEMVLGTERTLHLGKTMQQWDLRPMLQIVAEAAPAI